MLDIDALVERISWSQIIRGDGVSGGVRGDVGSISIGCA
jgi:hypothetical protein